MEPVKDQGQFLRRDGLAVVGNGDVGLGAAFFNLQTQGTALGTEFDRVVKQIVNHLSDIVLIGHGEYRVLRHIHVHIQLLAVDLLLKGDQHLTGAFLQIKLVLLILRDAALILQTGYIKHTADQTAQALGLVGDNLQIVGGLLPGDGTVENAVDVAGDGGHGGFQLMGDVRYEFLALVFAFLQLLGHVVEGQSQILHLFGVAAVQLDPGLQIAVTERAGGVCHQFQRITLPVGEEGHGDEGDLFLMKSILN